VIGFGRLKRLQKLFFHTPAVHAFILGSVAYHDYFWFPVHGTKVVKEWLKTPWGKLFETY